MTGYLLDTNVISELNKPRPNSGLIGFIKAQDLEDLYLSEVTIAEIRYGIAKVPDVLKRAALEAFLSRIRAEFHGRILPVSENVIFRWRLLVDVGRAVRHTFSQPDLFIAATALEHSLAVVTRDANDFGKTGVAILNPWTPP